MSRQPKNIPFLERGDEIRIIAPASVVRKQYIESTVKSLTSLGFKTSLGEYAFSVFNQFAGTDEDRLRDLQTALDDPGVKAVFCARGGYGAVRIFNHLNYDLFLEKPKWIVGFSDITIFHILLNNRFNLPSIHAPMPVNAASDFFQNNLNQLNRILCGEQPAVETGSHVLNIEGEAEAVLVGGNLSIIYSLQGTPWELQTDDRILFIEEVGEQLYHLDRMLQNLQLSGKIQGLKGLIVGGLTSMKDKKRPFGKNAEEIILEYVEDLGIPVSFGFPAGHVEDNESFILGREVEFVVKAGGTVLRYK